MDADELVNAYFSAFQDGDVAALRSLVADEFRIWHSFDDEVHGFERVAEQLVPLAASGEISYVFQEQLTAGNRVVRRHRTRFKARSGKVVEFPVTLFFTVKNGLVVCCEEYVDSASVTAIRSAILGKT